jgi:hypothetical protein
MREVSGWEGIGGVQVELYDGGREIVEGLFECWAKGEYLQVGRESVYWLIETEAKREVEEGGWEVIIDRLVERVTKRYFSEGRREVVYGLIKFRLFIKCEFSERAGEVVDGLFEVLSDKKAGESCREVINLLIETST